MNREDLLVELVTETGQPIGSATVAHAHESPGLLHRAFSVLLLDAAGRTLLQRRAATKTRFPLRWANACCGHPAPGEDLTAAAGRRLDEELGLGPIALSVVGAHLYRARDAATTRVEHEYDHVLVGRIDAGDEPAPDPAEVAELRWTGLDELRADLAARPERYAPWLAGVVEAGLPGLCQS